MKHIYLFLLLFLAPGLSAQQVDSVVVAPAAPTTNDTVKIYIYLTFPSSGCADVAYATQTGNTIYGYAFHCMGMISAICNDVDTVVLPPMAAGSYTFLFTLDAGYGPPGNCSPGIVPYDYDTAYFSVSTSTGIAQPGTTERVSLFPNPAADAVQLYLPAGATAALQLINATGEIVREERVTGNATVDVSMLAPGIYFYRIVSSDSSIVAGKLQVTR